MVTKPPTLTHVSVPAIRTKPAPKLLQVLVRTVGCDFARPDGCDNFGFELGSTNVCAMAPELLAASDAIITATTRDTVQRVILFMPRIFSLTISNR
jgi:hypothetical protein